MCLIKKWRKKIKTFAIRRFLFLVQIGSLIFFLNISLMTFLMQCSNVLQIEGVLKWSWYDLQATQLHNRIFNWETLKQISKRLNTKGKVVNPSHTIRPFMILPVGQVCQLSEGALAHLCLQLGPFLYLSLNRFSVDCVVF